MRAESEFPANLVKHKARYVERMDAFAAARLKSRRPP
jgi:hypothetical protein